MRKSAAVVTGLCAVLIVPSALAQIEAGELGKEIAFNRAKGNCLACHGFPTLPDAAQTGNSGPPLIAMQARFPDKSVLRAKIWDATTSHPASFMPPFGKHHVLSEEEIDKVVDFVQSL